MKSKQDLSINRAIFFDFDGVFVDTGSINYELSRKYVEGLSREEFDKWFTGNIHDRVKDVDKTKLFEGKTYNENYYNSLQKVPVIEGMEDLMKGIKSKAFPTFVITSAETYMVHDFFDAHGMLPYFDKILGSDINYSKVKKFEMIRDEYNIDLTKSLFITDTLGDLREAEYVNLPSIAVTWGYHNENTLRDGMNIGIVHTVEELQKVIEENI